MMSAQAMEALPNRTQEQETTFPQNVEVGGVSYQVVEGTITHWKVDSFGHGTKTHEEQGYVAQLKDKIGQNVAVTKENYARGPELIKALDTNDFSQLDPETQDLIGDSVTGLSHLCRILVCHGAITPDQYTLLMRHCKSEVNNPDHFRQAHVDGPTNMQDHLRMVQIARNLPENYTLATKPDDLLNLDPYTTAVNNITPAGYVDLTTRSKFFTVTRRVAYVPGKGFTTPNNSLINSYLN